MKLAIAIMTTVSLGLACTALADNYSTLLAQGYRWVTVHGPYASSTEQGVQRIAARRTDATELQMIENGQTHYLIPGTIVQVVKEDRKTASTKTWHPSFSNISSELRTR
jgi:hypothetical protein